MNMKNLNESESVALRHYAFLGFLTLINVMNFVDRQLIASFANFIKPDLQLTDTEFGYLTGIVFIAFYAVGGLFMGALADLVHRPRLVAIGLALWSALTAVSGAAKGFVTLAIPRMFIGVGESVLTPTAMSMLSDRFPATRLGFASGFYYMGVPVGVAASLLIAGYLGPAIGWRNCFYALGAIGLVLAVVLLFIKETPRRHLQGAGAQGQAVDRQAPPPRRQLQEAPGSISIARRALGFFPALAMTMARGLTTHFVPIARTLVRVLGSSPALALTMAGGVATHFILGAAVFDQLWYVEERGFDKAYIARVTGWIAVFGGIAGNLFGGWGSDWWQKRFSSGRPMFLVVLTLVLAPIGFAYRLVEPDSWFFWFAIFCGFFQLGSFYGPTFSTVQELTPPAIRATVVAFYILTLNLIGVAIGSTAAGYSIDWMRDAGVAEPYTITLLVFTAISATAIPLFYMAARRFHRDRDRLYQAMQEGRFAMH